MMRHAQQVIPRFRNPTPGLRYGIDGKFTHQELKYIYFIVSVYLHISILFTDVQYDTFCNLRQLPGALCLLED
jgi:hypothetical protein